MQKSSSPPVRIFPMSDGYLGPNQTISDFFTRDILTVSANRPVPGRFNVKGRNLNAPPGSLVLLQYKAALVAHAGLLSVNKADSASPIDSTGGFMLLQINPPGPAALRFYKRPISLGEVQKFWPEVKRFSQAMHELDAGMRDQFLVFASQR